MAITEATPHQFPFLASITMRGSVSVGILISPEWVLTTADIVWGDSAELIFGAHVIDTFNTPESTPYLQEVTVREFHVHENHAEGSFANNLSLIRLPEPLALNAGIQPLTRLNRAENLVGQQAISVGRGRYSDRNGLTPAPQIVDVSVIDAQAIADYFGAEYAYPSQLAVDIEGAPIHTAVLLTSDPEGFALAGLFSFGAIAPDGPDVYSHIACFEDWIRSISGVTFD